MVETKIVKNGTTIPNLRFGEFENKWKKVAISKVVNIYDGTHQTPTYVDNGVPFVSVENINNYKKTNKFITAEAFENEYKIKPQKGDILMTRITAGIIGATTIVEDNNPLAYYVSLALLRLKNNEVEVEYLNQYMASESFRRELHKKIIHIAFPKKINLGEISHCVISYPETIEQIKITSFLTAVDKRIFLLENKKVKLEEYKKGMMQQIFNRKIRFKDNIGEEFPIWKKKNISEVFEVRKGKQLNRVDLIEDGKYPSISGGINPSGYTNNWNEEAGTIIISEGGNSCGYVNFIKIKFWCGGHCYSLKPFESNSNKTFLYQLLKFNQKEIMRLRVGSGLPNIQKKDLSKFKIETPVIEEQNKIADFLNSIDDKISLVNQQIEGSKMFKKGLLQQMFL